MVKHSEYLVQIKSGRERLGGEWEKEVGWWFVLTIGFGLGKWPGPASLRKPGEQEKISRRDDFQVTPTKMQSTFAGEGGREIGQRRGTSNTLKRARKTGTYCEIRQELLARRGKRRVQRSTCQRKSRHPDSNRLCGR